MAFEKPSIPNEPEFKNYTSLHSPQDKDTFPPINSLQKIFLNDITDHPFDGVEKRIKRLGLHPSVVSEIHSSLEKNDILLTTTIDRKKLFDLTIKGRICAEKIGIKIKKQQSKGGLEHAYWINEIVQFLRKHEFQPICEKNNIDIIESDAKIAIEVETGKSDIAANLLKLENYSSIAKFMLATSKPVEFKIKKLARPFPSIKVMSIKDFFKLTTDQIMNSNSPKVKSVR